MHPAIATSAPNAGDHTELSLASDHASLVRCWTEWALPEAVRAGELAECSLRTYRRAASYWLQSTRLIHQPTASTVKEWVISMKSAGLSASSMATYLAAIKSLYNWADSNNLYPNIARGVKQPKVYKDSPLPCPTSTDVSRMYQAANAESIQGKRDRAILAIMYCTAFRCVSLRRAKVADLDLTTGTIRHQPKGHKEKDSLATLSPTAIRSLQDYLVARGPLDQTAPLFVAVGNRRDVLDGLTEKSIRTIVVQASEGIGLIQRNEYGHIRNRGHYSAHSIRRAAITKAAECLGMDTAQTLAGHASSDTTRRAYARINRYKQLQNTAAILDL